MGYLFLTQQLNLVTATKKPHSKNSRVNDDAITLDVSWEDILWQMLSCIGLTFFYVKIVKVITFLKKLPQRILGLISMTIIIYYCNY